MMIPGSNPISYVSTNTGNPDKTELINTALASSFMTFYNFVAILTLRRTESCHANFVILHVKLQIIAEISRQNEGVIRHL